MSNCSLRFNRVIPYITNVTEIRCVPVASVYSRHPVGGNNPQKSYIPQKNLSSFFVFRPRIIYCYKKLTIKLLFNFNNFNSRLPASSQHYIKYFNPQKAHPCVIPCILSHHASKSVKSFDLCACLRKKCDTKSCQLLGASPPDTLTRGSAPGPAEGHSP